jgi:hypothetical protein
MCPPDTKYAILFFENGDRYQAKTAKAIESLNSILIDDLKKLFPLEKQAMLEVGMSKDKLIREARVILDTLAWSLDFQRRIQLNYLEFQDSSDPNFQICAQAARELMEDNDRAHHQLMDQLMTISDLLEQPEDDE